MTAYVNLASSHSAMCEQKPGPDHLFCPSISAGGSNCSGKRTLWEILVFSLNQWESDVLGTWIELNFPFDENNPGKRTTENLSLFSQLKQRPLWSRAVPSLPEQNGATVPEQQGWELPLLNISITPDVKPSRQKSPGGANPAHGRDRDCAAPSVWACEDTLSHVLLPDNLLSQPVAKAVLLAG